MSMQEFLKEHARAHPKMAPEDVFKFLYQGVFGCEHLLADPESVIRRIQKEEKSLARRECRAEPLSAFYCRVPLGWLAPKTLGSLFCRSANEGQKGTAAQLERELQRTEALVREGVFSFRPEEFEKARTEWAAQGYPALHHTPEFRKVYHPAYRVIGAEYLPYLPLLAAIDRGLKKGALTLAIEGGSAGGKSTLAGFLHQLYDCTLFHMDDFFLRQEQRTPARLAEPGGNVDRERFLEEVLRPLRSGNAITYRPYDCSTRHFSSPITVMPKPLTVIEGAYSMHPELAGYYDLSAFLEIDPTLQRSRIQKRNSPQMAERFFKEWIPLECLYFEKLKVKERCSFIIKSG